MIVNQWVPAAHKGDAIGDSARKMRAMLRAIGMTDDDWVKPQVGIASAWNEVTPCNMTLRKLAAD